MALEEPVHHARRWAVTGLLFHPERDLRKGQIRLGIDPVHDQVRMAVDDAVPPGTALRLWRDIAALPGLPDPADRRRVADAKPGRRPAAAHTAIDGSNDTGTKVNRKSCRHQGWPPSPALILNQKFGVRGIPEETLSDTKTL